jgi:glucuronate isomerase
MQLHMGVTRNICSRSFAELGPDTGFDAIGDPIPLSDLYAFLDSLDREDLLPKTILYSLNPQDNTALDVLCGAFQRPAGAHIAKLQHGSAWWFNDHQDGIRAQLSSLAAQGVLGNFIGMLTDSRSFLSYARHDYFRRILCDYFGRLVEDGEYPADWTALTGLVEDICWKNAARYFGLG